MNIVMVLIAASMSIAGLFLAAFIWACRNGQYDDMATPAMRMLHDDKPNTKQTIKDSSGVRATGEHS